MSAGFARCCGGLADTGHTVFVSSHLMSEMALTATRLVVVGRGRLIADTTVEEFVALAAGAGVRGAHAGGHPATGNCCSPPMSR